MKKVKYILRISCCLYFLVSSVNLFAQAQLQHWYIDDKDINVTTVPPTLTTIPNLFSLPSTQVANGMYDENGNLLFYIADGYIYDRTGNIFGGIQYAGSPASLIPYYDQVLIVPFYNNDNCLNRKYNVIYGFTTPTGYEYQSGVFDIVVDMNGNSGLGSASSPTAVMGPAAGEGVYSGEDGYNGLAVSQPNGSGVSFLYWITAYTNVNGTIWMCAISPTGTFSGENLIATNDIGVSTNIAYYRGGLDFQTQQLSLSPDGKWLAWASAQNAANSHNYLYDQLQLNPVTGLFTGFTAQSNAGSSSNNTTGYWRRGAQFDPTSTYVYFGGGNDGIYQLPIGTVCLLTKVNFWDKNKLDTFFSSLQS